MPANRPIPQILKKSAPPPAKPHRSLGQAVTLPQIPTKKTPIRDSLLQDAITRATGAPFEIRARTPLSGGCINDAQKLVGADNRSYFLKTNRPDFAVHFEAEFEALSALASSQTLKVPQPIAHGCAEDAAYLVLEFIETSPPSPQRWEKFGRQLAALHATPQPHFGWHRNNVIGSTPQPNPRYTDWPAFFRGQRIAPQLALCRRRGLRLRGAEKLLETLPTLLENHSPHASLLHGDLWSGNAAFDRHGEPFVYDPCCYYGDRETDLAFTEFFGGFHPRFYDAYQEALPLESGYPRRKTLYNLYHCLNHYNLFGSSYANQAQIMIDQLTDKF